MTQQISKCYKKDPSTCRLHGTAILMEQAKTAGDFETYFQTRTKLEKLKASGYKEHPEPKTEQHILDILKTKNQRVMEDHISQDTKYIDAEDRKYLGLEDDVEVTVGKAKIHGWNYLIRNVYKRERGGEWEKMGSGVYSEYDIQKMEKENPEFTKTQLLTSVVANKLVTEQKINKFRI